MNEDVRNFGDIHTLRSAKVVQLIETDALAGDGTEGNPFRRIIQYWTFEGVLKASFDQWQKEQEFTKSMQATHDRT